VSLLDAFLLDPASLDIWVAARTDDVSGSGTEDDPYNGADSASFDGIMRALAVPPSPAVAVRLGPGIFQTKGYSPSASTTWSPVSGMKILGSGVDVSVLQLVGASIDNGAYGAISSPYNDYLDSFEAGDFTVDCNVSGQPSQLTACGAVAVVGKHTRLRRLRAINFGTQTGAAECFVLSATEAHPDLDSFGLYCFDCWIADCVLEQPGLNDHRETTLTIMSAGERPTDGIMAYHRACVIRNCFVDCEFRQNPVSISSISIVGGVATVTTRLPHGHQVNDWVRISGVAVGGSTNNSFNGSYKITSPTTLGFQYTPNPAQSSNPDAGGNLWLGRWSSQVVAITGISNPTGTGPYTVTVTTATPHFLAPGQTVGISLANPPYGGLFQVYAVTGAFQFQIQFPTNPGSPSLTGNEFIGMTFQACTADGGTAAVVEGNRFLNAHFGGPYHDTWRSKDMMVRNNYYRGVLIGPYQNMGGHSTPTNNNNVCSSLTNSGTLATATTPLAHGLLPGQGVVIAGATVGGFPAPLYNGTFAINTVPSSTTFTYLMTGTPTGPSDAGSATFGALWQVGRLVIENNFIELVLNIIPTGWGPPCGILIGWSLAPPAPPIFLQVLVRRNVIHDIDYAFDTSGFPVGIRLLSCGKGVIEDDVIDLNSIWTGPQLFQQACASLKYFNNQTSAGNLIQAYNYDIQQYVNEIASDTDLALLEAF